MTSKLRTPAKLISHTYNNPVRPPRSRLVITQIVVVRKPAVSPNYFDFVVRIQSGVISDLFEQPLVADEPTAAADFLDQLVDDGIAAFRFHVAFKFIPVAISVAPIGILFNEALGVFATVTKRMSTQIRHTVFPKQKPVRTIFTTDSPQTVTVLVVAESERCSYLQLASQTNIDWFAAFKAVPVPVLVEVLVTWLVIYVPVVEVDQCPGAIRLIGTFCIWIVVNLQF